MYYIYMLRCRDGSFYTGIAADIEKRLRQHASGGAACAKYTRLPTEPHQGSLV